MLICNLMTSYRFNDLRFEENARWDIAKCVNGRILFLDKEIIYVPRHRLFYKLNPINIDYLNRCSTIEITEHPKVENSDVLVFDNIPTIEKFICSKSYSQIKIKEESFKLNLSINYENKIEFTEYGVDVIDAFIWAYTKMLQYMSITK